MLETGNNISQSNDVLSIRLSSNGQYFSVADDNSPVVKVTLDTEQMVLVPQELFNPGLAESYLKINSCNATEGQCTVTSVAVDGVIAVIAWDAAQIADIQDKFGERVEFSSPILDQILHKTTNSLEIYTSETRAYITLFSDKLEYAECLPYASLADILYYMENLKGLFGFHKRSIYIYGSDSKTIAKTLKQYYRKVILGNK